MGLQTVEIWRKVRGMLVHKGPKNVTAWQKKVEKTERFCSRSPLPFWERVLACVCQARGEGF